MASTSAASADDKKKTPLTFLLKSNDGQEFSLEEEVAFQCNLLKKMATDLQIEDADSPMLQEAIPVHAVDGWALQKIIDWCVQHRGQVYKPKEEHEDPRITLTKEDTDWMDVSSDQLLALLLGANYLDIPAIIDIITQKIADLAIGKTVEEIREIYGLENDFTPEEEEELRKRFEWIES